jgi:hypothetical protein
VAGARGRTGLSPSKTSRSRGLRPGPLPEHPLQITTRAPRGPDFKFERLPLHSPLLRQSLLVSFPPLIDMLKFSGYPHLIRGQPCKINGRPPGLPPARALACCAGGRATAPTSFGGGPYGPAPTPSGARGLKWRSDRCAPRNARGRNMRSKIR